MRSYASIWLVLTGAISFLGCAKPQVDSHGDGAISLPLKISVLDARSGAPIAGATIVFYKPDEVAWLREIAEGSKAGRTSLSESPKGTTARTLIDGSADITCLFSAAFLWSRENGERKEMGTHVFPDGEFLVSHPSYRSLARSAREIYPSSPYVAADFKNAIVLHLVPNP